MLKERFTFYDEASEPNISFKSHSLIQECHKGTTIIMGPAITRLAEFEELGMEPDELMAMIQEVKAAHATKLLECKVCGTKFEPTKERHYVIEKPVNILTRELSLGDAFDCPKCGCQVNANYRYDRHISLADLGVEKEEEE